VVEFGFSCVTYLLSKVCNSLDVAKRCDFGLSLTTEQLDIQKFASGFQAQGTH
jgi:hypothetical protein